jgi:hypothetical protein
MTLSKSFETASAASRGLSEISSVFSFGFIFDAVFFPIFNFLISASREPCSEYPDREFRPNQHQSQQRNAAKDKPRTCAFHEPQNAFANNTGAEKHHARGEEIDRRPIYLVGKFHREKRYRQQNAYADQDSRKSFVVSCHNFSGVLSAVIFCDDRAENYMQPAK